MKQFIAIALLALALAGCSGGPTISGGPQWAGDLWRDIDRNNGGGE